MPQKLAAIEARYTDGLVGPYPECRDRYRARSPILRLQATSTLELWNNFDIEPFSASTWYDRANIGIRIPLDTRVFFAKADTAGQQHNG